MELVADPWCILGGKLYENYVKVTSFDEVGICSVLIVDEMSIISVLLD
jgi:hypothetical protein